MGFDCINWKEKELNALLHSKEGFSKITITNAINRYRQKNGVTSMPSIDWIKRNSLLLISYAKEEAGLGKFPSEVYSDRKSEMYAAISYANNNLYRQGINRVYGLKFYRVGESGKYTWELIQNFGTLRVKEKAERLQDANKLTKLAQDTEKLVYPSKSDVQLDLFGNAIVPKFLYKDQEVIFTKPTEQEQLDQWKQDVIDKNAYDLEIKEGVTELFESNPELASIGTQEQYSQYLDSLNKPNTNPILQGNQNPDVILPIGTSGSGKSTFIKSLPQENLVVIEPDAMRVEFTGNMNNKSKDKEIYIEAAKRAIKAIKQGKQVVFDTTNLTKDKRLPFIEAIKKEIPNANIQYKLMELNPELAKQRIKAQLERGENRAAVSDETIDRHAASYKQMLEDIKSEPISNYDIQKEQVKKFIELQERLNNKEFLEGAKNAYESSKSLQQFGTQEEYNDYIARVSLGIIKNPSSGDYNYTSQVKDIVWRNDDSEKNVLDTKSPNKAGQYRGRFFGTYEEVQYHGGQTRTMFPILLNITKPYNTDSSKKLDYFYTEDVNKIKQSNDGIVSIKYDTKQPYEYVVFESEQIHILGSKQDIQGFKDFVDKQDTSVYDLEEGKDYSKIAEDDYESLMQMGLFNDDDVSRIDATIIPEDTWEDMGKTTSVKSVLRSEPNNRFYYVAKQMEKQLDYYYKIRSENKRLLYQDKIGKITITPDKRLEINKQIAQQTRVIKLMEAKMLNILKIKGMSEIYKVADDQLAEIEQMISFDESGKKKLSDAEIVYMLEGLNTWIAAGTIDVKKRNILLEPEEIESETPVYQEIKKNLQERKNRANNLRNHLLIILRSYLEEKISHEFDREIKLDYQKALKDVNWWTRTTVDISELGDPVLDVIHKWNKTANYSAQQTAIERLKELDGAFKNARSLMKKYSKFGKPYDIFMQEQTIDPKTGRTGYTGDLVDMFSQDYWNEHNRHYINNKMPWGFIKKHLEWIRENELSFDPRVLFPEKSSYKPSNKAQEALKKQLKETLGEKTYEELYQKAQRIVEAYWEDREAFSEMIKEELLGDEAKYNMEMQNWENNNSPYKVAEYIETGVFNKNAKPSFEYLLRIPKKEIGGKETGYYDSKYAIINADGNEALREAYDMCISVMNEVKQLLPTFNKKLMRDNALPDIEASILESFAKDGALDGLTHMWQAGKQTLYTSDESTLIRDQDVLTGERTRKFQIRFMKDHKQEIQTYIDLKTIEYKKTEGKKPPIEQIRVWRGEIIDELAAQKSFDLHKVIGAFSMLGLSVYHKQQIENSMLIAQKYIDSKSELLTTESDKNMKNAKDQEASKSNKQLRRIHDMVDYFYDNFYGYPSHKQGGKVRWKKRDKHFKVEVDTEGNARLRKSYIGIDKKLKNQINDLKKQNERDLKSGAIDKSQYVATNDVLNKYLDTLHGGIFTGSKVGDQLMKYTQIAGMGWNINSGINNMLFGFISNFVEAGAGRIFNQKQICQAYLLVTGSILKNYSFDAPIEYTKMGLHGVKIRNIMDRLDVLKESKYEVMKKKQIGYKGIATRPLKKLSPYEIQSRTEYINQATTTVACLLNIKITDKNGKQGNLWEALDKTGHLKEIFRTDENIKNYEGDLFNKEENKKLFAVKARVDKAVKIIHGNYDPDSYILALRTLSGRALLQFRRWALQGFVERFSKAHYDSQLDMMRGGRYRSGIGFVSFGNNINDDLIEADMGGLKIGDRRYYNGIAQTAFNIKYLLKKLSFGIMFKGASYEKFGFTEHDAANLKKNLNELIIYMFILLIRGLSKLGDDDDNKKKSQLDFLTNMLFNNMNRMQMDILFYVNPIEFRKLFLRAGNLAPALKLIDDILNLGIAISQNLDDNPKNDIITRGPSKGQNKVSKTLLDMAPFTGQVRRFERLYKQKYIPRTK